MMDRDALLLLQTTAVEAAKATVELDGKTYSPLNLIRVDQPERDPPLLEVHTLQALVDYLAANLDLLEGSATLLHVKSPSEVDVVSNLFGEFNQRHTYVHSHAILPSPPYPFGRFLDLEEAVILFQTRFVDDPGRAELLRFLGNVRTESVKTKKDDGVTQEVTARAGVVGLESVEVPNPILLAPFRTFPEVDQPHSPFLLRLKMVNGEPAAFLDEADGGAWQLEAIRNVVEWLREETKGAWKILG
jgi:hypothetical protein